MPLYEYECECGNKLELLQGFNDAAPICKNCEKEMKKKISLSSFQLKGSGWYASDYKNAPAKKTESPTYGEKTSNTTSNDE